MVALVSALAVFRVTVAIPKARSSGPDVDLDQLHPPVRHRDQAAEQHTVGDVEVVLALDVTPAAPGALDQGQPDQQRSAAPTATDDRRDPPQVGEHPDQDGGDARR